MATYYVAVTGSDGAAGSSASPFRTIDRALNQPLGAGDTIIVRPGTYNEAVIVDRGGSAAGDVTLKSEVPGAALIRPPSSAWNAVSVTANYVTVDGFDIRGTNGDGIEVNNRHHVTIRDNIIHDAPESGIQFNWSEFITVDGNVTYNNAASGWYSGISIYQSRNITGDTSTPGFRTVVRNNVSYDNVTEQGLHTDGNGIIIDDFQSTQVAAHPNYDYPTLVENNLVYNNGGKGIAVHWSDNVTVRNNTAWHNNLDRANDGTWRGELSNQDADNNVWVNNIAVADPSVDSDNTAIGNYSLGGPNRGLVWRANLTFDGTPGRASLKLDGGNPAPTAADGNRLGVDPRFVDAPRDFRLAPNSPAIDAGDDRHGLPANDLDGGPRAVGTVDLGAYENGSAAPSVTARDDLGRTGEDDTVVLDLLANDESATGRALSVLALDLSDTNGTARIDGSGRVVYDPGDAFAHLSDGESRRDTFAYTVTDGAGGTARATVAVKVRGANDAPVAADDGFDATAGAAIRIAPRALFGNDADVDRDRLTLAGVDDARNGEVWINDAGKIVFVPDDAGTASFRYTVTDPSGATDSARVWFAVDAPDRAHDASPHLDAIAVVPPDLAELLF